MTEDNLHASDEATPHAKPVSVETPVEAVPTRSPREQAAFDLANAWFETHCRHGAVARVTDAYNQMFEALPDLVKRIVALD